MRNVTTVTRALYATAAAGVSAFASILLPPNTLIRGVHLTLAASWPTANGSPMWSQLLTNNLGTPSINDNPGVLASIMVANGAVGGTAGVSEFIPLFFQCNPVYPTTIYLGSFSASGANNFSYSHAVLYLA